MKMDCCHHAEARKAQTGQRGRGFSYMFFERKERGDLSEGIGRGKEGRVGVNQDVWFVFFCFSNKSP